MCKSQSSSNQEGDSPETLAFVVGQDASGHWLALETHGLGGGLFKTRADAIRFADFEADHRPGAVAVSTDPLKLSF